MYGYVMFMHFHVFMWSSYYDVVDVFMHEVIMCVVLKVMH